MATLPLDLRNLADELSAARRAPGVRCPAGTAIGHVHLQVAEHRARPRPSTTACSGFDVTTRGYPGALFVSAGGYHHHLGLNTWHSAGSGPAAPGSVGLRSYEIVAPRPRRACAVCWTASERPGSRPKAESDDCAALRDPSGNLVILRCQ